MKGSRISCAASRTATTTIAQIDRKTTRERLRGRWMRISAMAPTRDVEEVGREMVVGPLQVLGHHPYVADYRHEVGVTIPPRDDVDVEVVGDACARSAPEVHSDVEPLRVDRSAEAPRSVSRQPKESIVLFVG